MIKLYKTDARGGIRIWTCEEEGVGILKIQHGILGGEMQTKIEHIEINQSGRNIDEQMLLEANSRARSKMQHGYKPDIEEAIGRKNKNQLDLHMPMLAKEYDERKHARHIEDAYIQYKYDGNRCLIHNSGDQLIAYTRNGKPIANIEHIMEEIDIPVGMTLDGELYAHGIPLQTIVSLIKRKQEDTKLIKYIIYDTISNDSFGVRYEPLLDLKRSEHYLVAPTCKAHDNENIKIQLEGAIKKGYEGLIMRTDDRGYESGKRSESLLKIKRWQDNYYTIIDIEESADNWAILICSINNKTFRVSCPGTLEYRTHVLNNKDEFIGKEVRVEYAYLTKDGIPFHPIATLIQ